MQGAHVRRPVWVRDRRRLAAVWWLFLLTTCANGLVVGYGAVWFQFFGDPPDRSDYLMSAGAYAATAMALGCGAVGVTGLRQPRSAGYGSILLGLVFVVLAANAFGQASGAEPGSLGQSAAGSMLDGAGGVVCLPWTWALFGAGVLGAYRITARHRIDR